MIYSRHTNYKPALVLAEQAANIIRTNDTTVYERVTRSQSHDFDSMGRPVHDHIPMKLGDTTGNVFYQINLYD